MNIFAITATVAAVACAGVFGSAAFAQAAPTEAPAAPANAVSLTVSYTGLETQDGAIMVALYDSEAAFNGGAPVRVAMIRANAADLSTAFAGLVPGRYAIKSFHDVDGDNRMSMNPMGIPIEPFAFSNNARGNMGPPSWTDSVFEVNAAATTHAISFR